MNVVYRLEKKLPLEEVAALYRLAGWLDEGTEPALLEKMLDGAFAVQAAFDAENGRLLGMMRSLSDGCSDAYLVDLVVLPEARQQGIGKGIVERLVSHLSALGVDWIVCIGAPGTEAFYHSPAGQRMEGFFPWRFTE